MLKKEEVKTFIVRRMCEQCKTGEMEYQCNSTIVDHVIKFPHKCNNCGNVELYNLRYPYFAYEDSNGKDVGDAFGNPRVFMQEIGRSEF